MANTMALNDGDPPLVSSPLTEFPSSDFVPIEFGEGQYGLESSQEIADVGSSSDPSYFPDTGMLFTSTKTPLKNKPHGSRNMSSSSKKVLQDNAHAPGRCILTRATQATGLTVERSHMIPQATAKQQLRWFEWLLGYDAGTFDNDSHYNVTYIVQGWHGPFDARKWALVPEPPTRRAILQALTEIKGDMKAEVAPGVSPWPHFLEVYSAPDNVYRYRFLNIAMNTPIMIYNEAGRAQMVDVNGDDPMLTLESHIHPLHVIINACEKIGSWLPRPTDRPTLEIIDEIESIYAIWSSLPITNRFLEFKSEDEDDKDDAGRSQPRTSYGRRSRSSLGKRSNLDKDDDGDDDDGGAAHGRGKRYRGAADGGVGTSSRQLVDDASSPRNSCSSPETSVESCDAGCLDDIKNWQDSLPHTQAFSPLTHLELENNQMRGGGIKSPKVAGYYRWKPTWDRRWVDTSSFSSNDWAYYHRACDLTVDYLK